MQRHVDYAAMELAAANRKYDAMHEEMPFHDGTFPDDPSQWAKERSASHPYHYRDGVTLYVSTTDEKPDDEFLTWRKAVDDGDSP